MLIHRLAVKNIADWGEFEEFQIGVIQDDLDAMDLETTVEDDSFDGEPNKPYLKLVENYEKKQLIVTALNDLEEILDCLKFQFDEYRTLNKTIANNEDLELLVMPKFKLESKFIHTAILNLTWEEV